MTDTTAVNEPECPPVASRPRWKKLVHVLAIAGFAGLGWETYQVFLGDNFHAVLAGKVYRGAQPDPEELESLIKQYGIRTVVNLRGLCNGMPWYLDQVRVVQRLGINQEDVCLSAGRIPPSQELRRLVEVLDQAEYPIFFHCRRGSDRTGVACAVTALLQEKSTLADARRELHWRYGHLALGRPAYLDQFLDLYETWLTDQNRPHAPDTFRLWVKDVYRGGWCTYTVEEFRRLEPPGPVHLGQPIHYQIKVRNTGDRTWNFSTHGRAGYHLAFRVRDASGMPVLEGRAGLVDRDLAPGESLATTVVVPASLQPGCYRLTIDMLEEYHGWFFQLGAEPVEEELEIVE